MVSIGRCVHQPLQRARSPGVNPGSVSRTNAPVRPANQGPALPRFLRVQRIPLNIAIHARAMRGTISRVDTVRRPYPAARPRRPARQDQ